MGHRHKWTAWKAEWCESCKRVRFWWRTCKIVEGYGGCADEQIRKTDPRKPKRVGASR